MKILSQSLTRLRCGNASFRVVALVALLGAGGSGWWYLNDLKQPTQADRDAERSTVRAAVVSEMVPIRAALRKFKDDTGAYPTTEEGLDALVKAEVVTADQLTDSFGNAYHYKGPINPGSQGKDGEFDLFSAGKDGQPVTDDDISSAEVASTAES